MRQIFGSKDEVDEWFKSTLEGLTRSIATEAYHSQNSQASGEYQIVLHGLNRARERLYRSLGIDEIPEKATRDDLVMGQVILRNSPADSN